MQRSAVTITLIVAKHLQIQITNRLNLHTPESRLNFGSSTPLLFYMVVQGVLEMSCDF